MSTSPSSYSVVPFISSNDVVTIQGDPAGTEYLIVKKNPVKYILRSLADGRNYNCKFEYLLVSRKATDDELDSLIVKVDPRIRMGVIVHAHSDSNKWTYPKGREFVVLDVKDDRVRIIEKGGNDTGTYWTLAHTSIIVIP